MEANRPGTLRFWHQSMTELENLGSYRAFLNRHAGHILGAEAVIAVHGLRAGTYHGRTPTVALGNAFVYHRAVDQIIDNAIRAERESFDVFVIGSFSEPMLREIRSAVDIPVVGILESSMLTSCSLGATVAPIANAPEIASIVHWAVKKHGLESRVLPCVSMDPAMHEKELLAAAVDDPQAIVQAFKRAAQHAVVALRAEVIVPAESVLATVLIEQGLTQVEGAPIVDVLAVAWRSAVMMARLRAECGLVTSRAGIYARNDPELVALMAR